CRIGCFFAIAQNQGECHSHITVALYDDIDMRMTFPLVLRDGEEATNTTQNRTPVDYPLIEYIVEQQEPLLIESNVTQYVRELGIQAIDKPFTSWLGVPLITGDKAFGAFVVQATDTRRFDADDLRLMNIIVASTSIAIENARLYSQKSVRAEQLATLNQITSLLTGTLAPTEVLDIVVSSASTISEADAVSVYLIDDEQNSSLSLARNAGLSDAFLAKPATPLLKHKLTAPTISEYVTPDSLLIENLESVEAVALRQTLERENKQAFLEHPLIFAGRNLGLLVLYYNKPQRYHPEQVNMIQAFATQASQAINNAQRFDIADKELEQRVEQLYALSSMGRVINATIEHQRLFEIVLSYATDATKAPRGFIALYRRTGRLYVPASRGYPYTLFEDADFLLQGLSGQVLTSGQMKRIEDTRQETAYLPLDPHTRSLLAIPIMKGREILGLIMLESDLAGSFSESDGHFVGQIINQAVIALDNTQLFQRVRQARDNMKVVLDAMQEGIILIDNEGFVVQTNPHISMIELHPDAILNQSIDDLLAEPSLEFAKRLGFTTAQTVKQLIERDNTDWAAYPPHDFEIHGDEFGVRYMQRQIIPIRDEDRYVTGIMLVFYNKSEERELAIARESLSQMIVHDLRSPLTSVTTSLGLLQRLIPKEAEFAEVVAQTTSMSRSAIRKVLSRVDSLLDIAKMESGDIRLDREPSHLRHIVDNVIVGLEPLARDHAVTLQTEFDPKVPLVEIDADKIERAILNLVDNAIKYSPPDSSVKVRVSLADQHYVHIDVVDSGPGIPDEYKKKLFERYVQIEGRKTVRRGVGLGLTFCKLVAEAHQGDIWVVDNPAGQGSTFKIKLPTVAKKEGLELS
ncbi:MAG: GAF domain-containing protein, partial [Chloroflexota bacterium]